MKLNGINLSIARPNRFSAVITPPALLGASRLVFRDMSIEAIEMPGMGIASLDYFIDSRPSYKIPYQRTPAQQFNMIVRLEEQGEARIALKQWVDFAVYRTENTLYYNRYYNDIIGSAVIQQLDLYGNPTYQVTLANVYPVAIEPITYDWGDTNSYVRQSVTMCYFDETTGA